MRKIKPIAIALFFICAAFAGVAKADAYLKGFQALEQKDYKTALYFLSLFAANGDARANYNLGIMYREGLGVNQDDIGPDSFYRRGGRWPYARQLCCRTGFFTWKRK